MSLEEFAAMKSPKVKDELRPTPLCKTLQEKSMDLVEYNQGLPLDMVAQIHQGRQERLSGQSSEYKFGEI